MVGVRMVCNGKAVAALTAVFVVCAGVVSPAAASGREEAHQVPAVYVFGDSTVDVGNNQYLPGNAALQLPYGIDFPQSRPTGSRQIVRGYRGVNYASGGSGILDTTVEYFAATKSKMTEKSRGIDALLSKSLFLISDGGNDFFAFLRQNLTTCRRCTSWERGGSGSSTCRPSAACRRACCGGGRLGAQTWCGAPNATYCADRNDNVYWDEVHGTQATSSKGAKAIFAAPVKLGFAAPINFKQLLYTTSAFGSSPSSSTAAGALPANVIVLLLLSYHRALVCLPIPDEIPDVTRSSGDSMKRVLMKGK
ncbi:unnamed protein product [Triticum turgidum subsp. durum]|uniref:GDSL esterase/lipase n=1 Tax=Triticum turgidum subsp. durum TaxID=4567 RepID=A0A9R0Y682_TRITD|nr:unnamed protein product [Triticum turgidum subsp. durum]